MDLPMKKTTTLLLLLLANYCFAQTVNDYKAVIVPVKYDFLKNQNEYRLNTVTKFNLQKAGFVAFYNNEAMANEYNDRCSVLYVNVIKESGLLITKLYVTFSDCKGTLVYQSPIGKSKEKDFELAYIEALDSAFQSVYDLQYKYNGTNRDTVIQDKKVEIDVQRNTEVAQENKIILGQSALIGANVVVAERIANGYLLIDSESSKVVLKLLKTSNEAIFIAQSKTRNGVVVRKGSEMVFEYYENDELVLEKLNVKF
jgi:hypothetical protein